MVDGKKILVGNDKLMEEYHISYTKNHKVGTIIYVAIDSQFAGSIVISDKIKEDAYLAMEQFRKNQVQKVVMLTGDKENISKSVAKKLGIDEYHAELLPQEKVKLVEKYMSEKSADGKLVFVGDGINDAPVLAYADIGISMGGLGSDAAIEASEVVLMRDDLSLLPLAKKISRRTKRIVLQNIVFSIAIKIVVMVLGVFNLIPLGLAVFADVGVMMLAVLNSFRTRIEFGKHNGKASEAQNA